MFLLYTREESRSVHQERENPFSASPNPSERPFVRGICICIGKTSTDQTAIYGTKVTRSGRKKKTLSGRYLSLAHCENAIITETPFSSPRRPVQRACQKKVAKYILLVSDRHPQRLPGLTKLQVRSGTNRRKEVLIARRQEYCPAHYL